MVHRKTLRHFHEIAHLRELTACYANGDVTGEVESANGTTLVTNGYAYDAMNRVTQWTQGSAEKTYAYDSLGNNTDPGTGGTYNLVDNEELPNTGTACYDAAGSMIT